MYYVTISFGTFSSQGKGSLNKIGLHKRLLSIQEDVRSGINFVLDFRLVSGSLLMIVAFVRLRSTLRQHLKQITFQRRVQEHLRL